MALIWRVGMRIGVRVRARDKGADGCEGAMGMREVRVACGNGCECWYEGAHKCTCEVLGCVPGCISILVRGWHGWVRRGESGSES